MKKQDYKIVLFGNWNLGYKALKKLINNHFDIEAVITNYDLDCNTDEYRNKVYMYAVQNNIRTYKNYKEFLSNQKNFDNLIGISVSYGNEIFKEDILGKINIVNFHPSMLPYYRGPSPIEWQIKECQEFIGVSSHFVDRGIDTGDIISQKKYLINYDLTFLQLLDDFNEFFSKFVLDTIEYIFKNKIENMDVIKQPSYKEEYYRHKIKMPKKLYSSKLSVVSNFLNKPRICIFTGNRAEYGILLPLIIALSGEYYLDLFVSGAHLLPPWNTIREVEQTIDFFNLQVNIIPIKSKQAYVGYFEALSETYGNALRYFKKYEKTYPYSFAIVLGDRIETLGFALASFYSQIPIIHLCGGDIANVPYFDTNVRHSISKIAHIHMTTNEGSKKVLLQLGEEEWRTSVVGNLSYDYDRLGLLTSKEEIEQELGLNDDSYVVIVTYHASHTKSSNDNLNDFIEVISSLEGVENIKVIITYPNNDPGSELLIEYLKTYNKSNVTIVPNLGTYKYLSILKNFKTIVIGNSSSGLSETPYYCVPVLNIGDRQTDRFRGINVYNVQINKDEIAHKINYIIKNYSELKMINQTDKYIYGDGSAAIKAKELIYRYSKMQKEDLIYKKFIQR